MLPTTTSTAAPAAAATAPTTAAPPPAVTPPPAQPAASAADLKLTRPLSAPPCLGEYVVFVGASIEPSRYALEVQQLLDRHPGSSYVRTDQSCPSLQPVSARGTAIYAVYLGPFATKAEACSRAGSVGGGAYVKVLDTSSPATQQVAC